MVVSSESSGHTAFVCETTDRTEDVFSSVTNILILTSPLLGPVTKIEEHAQTLSGIPDLHSVSLPLPVPSRSPKISMNYSLTTRDLPFGNLIEARTTNTFAFYESLARQKPVMRKNVETVDKPS